jgi:hypothetical protein
VLPPEIFATSLQAPSFEYTTLHLIDFKESAIHSFAVLLVLLDIR